MDTRIGAVITLPDGRDGLIVDNAYGRGCRFVQVGEEIIEVSVFGSQVTVTADAEALEQRRKELAILSGTGYRYSDNGNIHIPSCVVGTSRTLRYKITQTYLDAVAQSRDCGCIFEAAAGLVAVAV
jgi:hypothetical protein